MDEFVYYKNSETSNIPNIEMDDVGKIESKGNNYYNVFFIRLNEILRVSVNDLGFVDLTKVGDEYDYKICDRCYKLLETEKLFSNNRIKKYGKITKRPSCKNCRKIIEGKSINKNDRQEWETIKPKNELFSCPICKKKSIAGLTKIVLDHNHKTGQVRGFICESCNTGIGRFKDDIQLLNNAIEWLKNTKSD